VARHRQNHQESQGRCRQGRLRQGQQAAGRGAFPGTHGLPAGHGTAQRRSTRPFVLPSI